MKIATEDAAVTRKEDLAWFQKRRTRWQNAPRPKLTPLSPDKPQAAAQSTSSAAVPSGSRTPALINEVNGMTISDVGLTTSTASSKPSFSFGAATLSTPSSKPAFGASTSAPSNPFGFGSSQQTTSQTGSIFGNLQLTPSIGSGTASNTAATPSMAPLTGQSSTAAAKPPASSVGTSNVGAFSFGESTLSTQSMEKRERAPEAKNSSIFSGINLTPSVPAPATSATNTTGPVFANINLVPSSGLASLDSESALEMAKEKDAVASESKPFSFGIASVSQTPAIAKPEGKVRNPGAVKKKTTVQPSFAVPASSSISTTSAFSAPASKGDAGSIFASINLVPNPPTGTSSADESSSKQMSVSAPMTVSSSTGDASSKSTFAAAGVAKSGSPFANINLVPSPPSTSVASEPSTTTFGITSGNNNKPLFGATAGPSPFTFGATKDANTSGAAVAPVPSTTSNIGSAGSDEAKSGSIFGSTTTFGTTSGNASKPLFGAATGPSPFTFGATKDTSTSVGAVASAAATTSNTGSTGSDAAKSGSVFGSTTTFGATNTLGGATTAPSPFTFGATTTLPTTTTPLVGSTSIDIKTKESGTPTPTNAGDNEPRSASKPSTPDSTSDYRSRLIDFYKKHNPEKLDTVEATLEKFKGNEEELFRKLQAKYEPTPTSKYPLPTGDGPSCFLEFTIGGKPAGTVVVKLFRDKVPLACDNFKALCTGSKGKGRLGKPLCYKNSKVHRVVPLFCVQMGDFTKGDGTGGESIYEPNTPGIDSLGRFKDESFLQHSKKGLVSMANNGANRNGSQFFFTLRPCPSLDGKHVVFGEVTSGMDVVEKIGNLKTTPKQRPEDPVEIVNCGEIVDGKEVPCEVETVKAPAPFAFGSTPGPGQLQTLGFGNLAATATASNSFGFGAGSKTDSSPFSFGAVASSLQAGEGSSGFTSGGPKESVGSTGTTSATSPSPFTFGSASNTSGMPSFGSLATSAGSSGFASGAPKAGFGSTGTTAATSPSPFTFGSASGTSGMPSFGSLATSAGSSGFASGAPKSGFGAAGTTSATSPSPFTFGSASNTSSMPSFGSLATSASSNPSPFTFGSMSSSVAGTKATQDSPFSFGTQPTDMGSKTAFSPQLSTGFTARVTKKRDNDESEYDDSSSDGDDHSSDKESYSDEE